MLSWQYSCDPVADDACIDKASIAEGVKAAAQASEYARVLAPRRLGDPPAAARPAQCD